MSDKIIVFVTVESAEQADRIALALVAEKLAACVNVLPGVRSCYIWEEKLNWSNELLLVIKTVRARFPQLEQRVREMHSYSVPEVVAFEIATGSESYLKWVEEGSSGG